MKRNHKVWDVIPFLGPGGHRDLSTRIRIPNRLPESAQRRTKCFLQKLSQCLQLSPCTTLPIQNKDTKMPAIDTARCFGLWQTLAMHAERERSLGPNALGSSAAVHPHLFLHLQSHCLPHSHCGCQKHCRVTLQLNRLRGGSCDREKQRKTRHQTLTLVNC